MRPRAQKRALRNAHRILNHHIGETKDVNLFANPHIVSETQPPRESDVHFSPDDNSPANPRTE